MVKFYFAIDQSKGASLAGMAETLCWHTSGGEPDKDRVRRAKDRLYKKKLIDVALKGWTLTKKGHDAALEAARISTRLRRERSWHPGSKQARWLVVREPCADEKSRARFPQGRAA